MKFSNHSEIPYLEPEEISRAISAFRLLPGVGEKSARRLVYWLIGSDRVALAAIIEAFSKLSEQVVRCTKCNNVSTSNPCTICADARRNNHLICVVSMPQDIMSVELTRSYDGVYHVLGGLLDPMRGVNESQLTIAALLTRVSNEEIEEVIFALDPSAEGDTTTRYIAKLLEQTGFTNISVLAQGISSGSSLEFADPRTLSKAFSNRRRFSGFE